MQIIECESLKNLLYQHVYCKTKAKSQISVEFAQQQVQ